MNLKREETNRGEVFYDGKCPLCTASAAKFAPILRRHGFDITPLQTPWVQERLGLTPGEPLTEMKLLTDDEKIFGGANAMLQIARRIWWAWPLFAFAKTPGAMILLRKIYRCIATNRACIGNTCQLPANPFQK